MDIFEKFNQLVSEDRRAEIIDLLLNYKRTNKLSVDEEGWVYWNLSDNFALLHNIESLYQNHLAFVNWGKRTFYPEKLHWFVSDATQALTLSLGNHFDEWMEWYFYACTHSEKTEENRGVRFESHRTAAGTALKLKHVQLLDAALHNMLNAIEENGSWHSATFSKLTYYSILLERNYLLDDVMGIYETMAHIGKLLSLELDRYFPIETPKASLLGSWDDLNSSRTSKQDLRVLFNNLGCAFTRVNKYKEALEVFDLILKKDHQLNSYGLAKYLVSLWKTSGNKKFVMMKFLEISYSDKDIRDVIRYEPILHEVMN